MNTTPEMDQMMKKAMTLLHSSHPNSAVEIRMMLDEIIKQRYGPEKMLINTLSKRHFEMEKNFPGRATTPPPVPPQPAQKEGDFINLTQSDDPRMKEDEVINLVNVPDRSISSSQDTNMGSDEAVHDVGSSTAASSIAVGDEDDPMLTSVDDDGNLKDFCDLNCCVCGEMMFTATNRLIECSMCGTLYHQECHKPPITNDEASEDQQHNWQCDSCFSKPSTSKAAGIVVIPDDPMPLQAKPKSSATSSRSSSSSNPSSPFFNKPEPQPTTALAVPPIAQAPQPAPTLPPPAPAAAATTPSSSSSRHHHKSSSSKSHKEERSSSSSKVASAPSTTEKSHSSSSSRRSSHSSSSKSKSSRHHESSSKRKSK